VKGARRKLRKPIRRVDLDRQLRHRVERVAVVELLKCLPAAVLHRNLADEEDQRRGILKRRVHTGGRVRRAGGSRDETDSGTAGHLSVGLGHVRGAGFVPRDDEPDRRVAECVEDADVALPRNAEGGVDAVSKQLVDEDSRPGARHSSIGSSKKTVARCSLGLCSSAAST
jgi:hypothetical protein